MELLAPVGSIVVAFSFLPYLRDTVKKKIKPRIATWSTWSLITGVATVAALSEGAYVSALLTGITTIVELSVLFFALKGGDRTYEKIDFICQAIAIMGIAGWILTSNPIWAIIFSILADMFAAIPTFYHTWIAPFEEAWHSFIIFAAGSFLTIFAIDEYSFINSAFPIYLTLIAASIGSFIIFRQKTLKT